ncbi:MAG TPA: hypothetical protein VHR72_10480 [Gemmataceae bacterium]|jgi:hypothetical protein|nr:hypothetical protein [Gemmataceae bacterium]
MLPSLPLLAFVATWNRSFPCIEEVDRKIAVKRSRIASASRRALRESLTEEIADLENERSRIAADREADPDAYAVDQALRLDVEIPRADDAEDAAFACLSWLIREFAPFWIEWLNRESKAVAGFHWFAVRLRNLPDIESHDTLLRAVPVILDFAARAEHSCPFDCGPSPDRVDVEETMHRGGWYAGIAGAEAGGVVSPFTEAMLDRLHFAVESIAAVAVAAGPLPIADALHDLRESAIRFLESTNAAGKQFATV